MGDLLQCVRYLPQVAALGGRVVLACHPPLTRLLGRTMAGQGIAVIDGRSQEVAQVDFDVYTHLLSLPGLVETTLETIPTAVPYLTAEPALVQQWRPWFAAAEGLRIGLVWAGNPAHKADRQRSLPLATLAPLAHVPHLALFSLQTGAAAAQLDHPPPGLVVCDVGRLLGDFADTAAVLAHLDLVLTVDTAVAHLAGAMGRPVWTLLPAVADWRWLEGREDSPWYPTMRLVRQARPGDWTGVVQRVVEAFLGA
jgi:hypothetical protein